MLDLHFLCIKDIKHHKLQSEWSRIEREAELSPFVRLEYMTCVFHHLYWFSPFYRPVFYCITIGKEGRIALIAPIRKGFIKKACKMQSGMIGCGNTDFIFDPQLTDEEKKECLDFLFSKIHVKWKFRMIYEASYLCQYLRQHAKDTHESTKDNVSITFGDSYDEYLSRLTKSTRQNLRTARNRLEKNNIDCHIEIVHGPIKGTTVWSQCQDLYTQRQVEKYKKVKTFTYLSRLYWKLYFKHVKFDTKVIEESKHTILAAIYFNEKIVGFLCGFLSKDQSRLVVPRLAIDSDYSFYSPGYLLLTNLIQDCQQHNNIRTIDLTRGKERYKTDLGGSIYFSYNYRFRC